jgi:predicted DCC family thiol-disulfide oxidoreductase YuxK
MTTAIFDGNCVICQQTRRIVTVLDWLHRVEFLDVQQWDKVYARYPQVDYNEAMGAMHVMTKDGQMLAGFVGVRRLMRDLPLGYPVWLFMHLPGMTWLGNKVYGFIAKHRYQINKLFGAPVCENGTCKVHY